MCKKNITSPPLFFHKMTLKLDKNGTNSKKIVHFNYASKIHITLGQKLPVLLTYNFDNHRTYTKVILLPICF